MWHRVLSMKSLLLIQETASIISQTKSLSQRKVYISLGHKSLIERRHPQWHPNQISNGPRVATNWIAKKVAIRLKNSHDKRNDGRKNGKMVTNTWTILWLQKMASPQEGTGESENWEKSMYTWQTKKSRKLRRHLDYLTPTKVTTSTLTSYKWLCRL